MSDDELEQLAEEFWSETGLGDVFPRKIEQALALKLPVTIIKLPIVTIRSVSRWLRRHTRYPELPSYRRELMGCLYADSGHGFIFVCGADTPEEQRLTLAHDAAHFLLDYWRPRLQVIKALGTSIIPVLDGYRCAQPEERLSAILAGIRVGPHLHLLPRYGDDEAANTWLECVESRADDLGRELVAPRWRVQQMLRELPRDCRPEVACQALGQVFGIPPYVFRSDVAARHRERPRSFVEDVSRVLARPL
ncbi:MAG: hypothetical protein NZM29_08220 [Nitrospira sp.]|nr:hypothetical protein [Nitrospira sp.]